MLDPVAVDNGGITPCPARRWYLSDSWGLSGQPIRAIRVKIIVLFIDAMIIP